MAYRANKHSELVHADSCDFAEQISDENLVEFEELYHALGEGYFEARCCINTPAWLEINRGKK